MPRTCNFAGYHKNKTRVPKTRNSVCLLCLTQMTTQMTTEGFLQQQSSVAIHPARVKCRWGKATSRTAFTKANNLSFVWRHTLPKPFIANTEELPPLSGIALVSVLARVPFVITKFSGSFRHDCAHCPHGCIDCADCGRCSHERAADDLLSKARSPTHRLQIAAQVAGSWQPIATWPLTTRVYVAESSTYALAELTVDQEQVQALGELRDLRFMLQNPAHTLVYCALFGADDSLFCPPLPTSPSPPVLRRPQKVRKQKFQKQDFRDLVREAVSFLADE